MDAYFVAWQAGEMISEHIDPRTEQEDVDGVFDFGAGYPRQALPHAEAGLGAEPRAQKQEQDHRPLKVQRKDITNYQLSAAAASG